MGQITAGYYILGNNGSEIDLSVGNRPSFINTTNIKALIQINSGKNGYASFNPASSFNSFNTIPVGAHFIIVALATFDWPGVDLLHPAAAQSPLVLTVGSNQTLQDPTYSIALVGSATDGDGNNTIQTVQWWGGNNDGLAMVVSSTAYNATTGVATADIQHPQGGSALEVGQYWAELRATDAEGVPQVSTRIYFDVVVTPSGSNGYVQSGYVTAGYVSAT